MVPRRTRISIPLILVLYNSILKQSGLSSDCWGDAVKFRDIQVLKITLFLCSGLLPFTHLSLAASGHSSRSQQIDGSINAQREALSKEYGEALSAHLKGAGAYPLDLTRKMKELNRERDTQIRAAEKAHSEERAAEAKLASEERKRRAAAAARDPRSSRSAKKTTANGRETASKPRTVSPSRSSSGISKPEVILDGSSVPKEIEFPGAGASEQPPQKVDEQL